MHYMAAPPSSYLCLSQVLWHHVPGYWAIVHAFTRRLLLVPSLVCSLAIMLANLCGSCSPMRPFRSVRTRSAGTPPLFKVHITLLCSSTRGCAGILPFLMEAVLRSTNLHAKLAVGPAAAHAALLLSLTPLLSAHTAQLVGSLQSCLSLFQVSASI